MVSPVKLALWTMDRREDRDPAVETSAALSPHNIEKEADRLGVLVREASIEELDKIIPSLISQTTKMQEMAADILKAFKEKEVEEERKRLDYDLSDEPPSLREKKKNRRQADLENALAETLFELSRQGVNVVIATHRADILKWLEVHVKKNPDDEQLVSLNQFPPNGREVEEDFETRIAEIKQELTKPFSDLYVEGL